MTTKQDILLKKSKWDSFFKDELERVQKQRKLIYSTQAAKQAVPLKSGMMTADVMTMNIIRMANNRVKTDVRDLQPSFKAIMSSTKGSPKDAQIYSTIINEVVMTPRNIEGLYGACDDLLDLDVCVMRLNVDTKFDTALSNIRKTLLLERVIDIENVFFDSSVPFQSINEEGRFQGYTYRDDNDLEIFEYWEKSYTTQKYGYFLDPDTQVLQVEKYVRADAQQYLTTYSVNEVSGIKYTRIEGEKVVCSDENWPFSSFPYKIGTAIALDNIAAENLGERLTLVPFADHVIDPQQMLNYATTTAYHSLRNTSPVKQAMYDPRSIKGFEKDWARRNVEDVDLRRHATDKNGNPIESPVFLEPPELPPIISEALTTYPTMINALLGVNLEQDVDYDMSGEAIKMMQMVRSKNAKLYRDKFLTFMRAIGQGIADYLPQVYDTPQFLTIDSYGNQAVYPINLPNQPNNINLRDMFDDYNVELIAGQSAASGRQLTNIALKDLYTTFANTPVGAQIQQATAGIYVSSLECPDQNAIMQSVKPFIPLQADQVLMGEIQPQELQQQAAQAQSAQSNQAQQVQNQMLQAKTLQASAQMTKAQAEEEKANAQMETAENQIPKARIEGSAELFKSLENK